MFIVPSHIPSDTNEFFAGKARIATAWRDLGGSSKACDVDRSFLHNLTTPVGILVGLGACLQLQASGWLHMGTVCSSFVWINQATHHRSIFFSEGNLDRERVRISNQIIGITVLYALLGWMRGATISIENPRNSRLIHSRAMQRFVAFLAERKMYLNLILGV